MSNPNPAALALPTCRSQRPEGCAQCGAAFSCHEARMGRVALPWPVIGLALLLLVGVIV